MIHHKRSKEEDRARSNLKARPEDLFDLIKKLTKKADKIGPLQRNNTNKNDTTAEVLNCQYKSVFSTPRSQDIIHNPEEYFKTETVSNLEVVNEDTPEEQEEVNEVDHEDQEEVEVKPRSLKNFNINTQIISNAIDILPPKSAPGPDGIPNLLLKNLKIQLIPKLMVIFGKSLETSSIPKQLLSAFIKPIKKPKKPRNDPASYRPVSLTSGLSKIFEHCVKPQLQSYLEDKELLSDQQHGFRPGRSCLTQLLKHYSDIITDLENGKTSETIYLDFAKAFDSVDKHILGKQIKKARITDNAGRWLFQFLSNRTQRTIAENKISSAAMVKSGVHQGTVLGPIMFLLMINSLTEEQISSRITLFADDTRIAHGVQTVEDLETLQNDLNKLFEWKNENNMKFNDDKFEHLSHGRNFKSLKMIPKGEFVTDEDDIIKNKSSVRDLGIEISQESNFNVHIAQVCRRAREKSNWIFQNFYARDPEFMGFMWKTFVQPVLDYGSQLWAPSDQSNLRSIESIFKNYSARAEQKLPESSKSDFWTRLKNFKIKSQQRRQERFRIITVWKILEGINPNCGLVWSSSERGGRQCTLPSINKKTSLKVQTLRANSFQVKAANLFNALPLVLRELTNCSLNKFKNQLDIFLWLQTD